MSVGVHTARGHAVRMSQNKMSADYFVWLAMCTRRFKCCVSFQCMTFLLMWIHQICLDSSSRVPERKQMTHTAIATAGHHHFGFVV